MTGVGNYTVANCIRPTVVFRTVDTKIIFSYIKYLACLTKE